MSSARQLLFVLALLLGLSACDNSRKEIVGKWKTTSGSSEVIWQFFENGTLSTGGSQGRYSFGDNKRIKVQTGSATFVHQFEINGDRMTLTDPKGTKLEFTRLK